MMSYSNSSHLPPNGATVIVRETETLRSIAPCVVGLVILIGIIGNIVIILAILADKNRESRSPCFLHWVMQNVSACDLGLLFFVCPIFAVEFARESWIFGRVVCSVMRPLDFTAQIVSFYSLCFVGIDTCYAVADPRSYQQKRNARVAGGSILGIWAVAITLTLPVWVFADIRTSTQGNDICSVAWPVRFPLSFHLYGLIFAFGLPLLTTGCCIISIIVNSNGKLWRPTPAESAKKIKEIVNLLVGLAISGALLCAPSYIVPLARGTHKNESLSQKDVHIFFTITCFVYAYSCIKPMLYIFVYSDICIMVADLIPSRSGGNIKAIRNGLKYNRSPRYSPAKPARGQQHYVDHRYPDSPISTRSYPGSRSRTDSRINLQNMLALQFTEDGWRRKTL